MKTLHWWIKIELKNILVSQFSRTNKQSIPEQTKLFGNIIWVGAISVSLNLIIWIDQPNVVLINNEYNKNSSEK